MNKELLTKKAIAVEHLSTVIVDNQPNVIDVRYEVYGNDRYYEEFLIVEYRGGAKSVVVVTGNSFSATFKNISSLLDSGDYSQIDYYDSIRINEPIIIKA